MIIRLRGKLGTLRIDASELTTIRDMKQEAAKTYKLDEDDIVISRDEKGSLTLINSVTVRQGQFKHGDMLYLQFLREPTESQPEQKQAATGGKQEASSSSSSASSSSASSSSAKSADRLRDIKKHWTYAEYEAFMATKQVTIKSQAKPHTKKVFMEMNTANRFQQYCRALGFQQHRVGHCYGYISDQDEVVVHEIYEPPQECTISQINLLEDKFLTTVDETMKNFGLYRVGVIIAHPSRKFILSGNEIPLICQLQQGLDEKFAVFTASPLEDMTVQIQAFEIADIARKIHEENGFLPPSRLDTCKTVKTAIVEAKETHDVDVHFLFLNLPMEYLSEEHAIFKGRFAIENRLDETQNKRKVVDHLKGLNGKNIIEKLSDFHFLLYLVREGILCAKTDIPVISSSIVQREPENLAGYEFILKEIR